MEIKDAQKAIINLVNDVKQIITEELNGLDEMTKMKWQVVDAARNVFGANYNYTHFGQGEHEGVVGVYKPTLYQLSEFNHEIRTFATVTIVDCEEKNGTNFVAVKVRIHAEADRR